MTAAPGLYVLGRPVGRAPVRDVFAGRGISLVGLAGLLLAGPVHSGTVAAIAAVSAALLVLGWGIGMAWPHLLTRVLQLTPDEDQDLAGSSVTTVQLTATAFGSALAGAVANVVGFSDGAGTGDLQSTARRMFALYARR
ncbi:hypothetical protein [Kitasatospora sp. NPDC057500]|uniref:hypothetical protein n=1 Tax=Kitasatospora sp. NPDC057500 TaxID=3346151 RepID=UPI0036B5F0D9